MNKIKFYGADASNFFKPTHAKLTYANGDKEMLTSTNNTRYYDEADKCYKSFNKFTKINNRTYV
mgnify:FL=1